MRSPGPILLIAFYAVMALITAVFAMWMLYDPANWFLAMPGDMYVTGARNTHFIRLGGVAYLVAALGFFWCARNLGQCRPVHIGVTAFFVGHAALHVSEMASGQMPTFRWLADLPLIFAPAAVLLIIALPPVWRLLTRG